MLNTWILQFNCELANYKATKPIFDAVDPNIHQVLAIQKQVFNRVTEFTYCFWGYSLTSDNNSAFKVCFMISKKVSAHIWSFQSHDQHVASLHMQLANEEVTIINVYNLRSNESRIQTWDIIQHAIHLAKKEVILLRNFNTHHTFWDGSQTVCKPQSDYLHTAVTVNELLLLISSKLSTWRRDIQWNVIDLTFASETIKRVMQLCNSVNQWVIMQNHISIDIHIFIMTSESASRRWYAMKKLNKNRLWQHLNQSNWMHTSCSLTALQQVLQEWLEKHCSKAHSCVHANSQWSLRVSELLAGTRWAR